ncbi:hypothetical protein [Microlunatus speluncae]|uniref:hypothetical protein n=1 Tax=Microlunatus speluncae TaxID=2594267 RepID=UPI0012663344|nr:hypothetical protein [Microlunatus speluncae]
MPDPDPWDFSEYADPDPRQSRPRSGDTGTDGPFGTSGTSTGGQGGRPGDGTAADPFAAGRDSGAGLTAADWTSGPALGGESAALEIARPPLPYLGAAAGIALLALLLGALLGATPGIAITAWVLAGPVAIFVLAYFIKADTTERARPIYAAPSWLRPGYVAVLVLCGVAVVVAALRIAFWVGRL